MPRREGAPDPAAIDALGRAWLPTDDSAARARIASTIAANSSTRFGGDV